MKPLRLFARLIGIRKARRLATAATAYTMIESVLGIDDYRALVAAGNPRSWLTGLSGKRIASYLYPVVSKERYTLREIDRAITKYVAETYTALRTRLFVSDREILDQLSSLYDYANLSIAVSLLARGIKPVMIYPFGVLALSGIDISSVGSLEELAAIVEKAGLAEIAAFIKKHSVSPGDMQRRIFSEFSRRYRVVRKKLNRREREVLDAYTDLSLIILAYTFGEKDVEPPRLIRIDWGVLDEAYRQGLENALANTWYSEYTLIIRDIRQINNTMTAYHQALVLYLARLANEILLSPLSLEPVIRAVASVIAEALYTRFLTELVVSGLDAGPLMGFLEKWWFR